VSEGPRPLGAAIGGTLFSNVIPVIAGAVGSIALARTLEPFSRGEMASVLIWPVAFGVVGDLGVSYALAYRVARDRDSASGLWTIGVLLSFLWGSGLALAGGVVLNATLTLSAQAALALRLALAGVPLTLMTGYASFLLLGSGALGASNVVRGISVVLNAAGILAVALLGKGTILTFVAVWLASQLVAAGVAAAAVRRRLGAGWRWSPALVRPVFSYALQAYASGLAFHLSIRVDQLLLSLTAASAELGLYVVGIAVASVALPFFSALATVTLQRVTSNAPPAEGGREVLRILRICAFFGIPVIVVGVLVVDPVVPLLFGQGYAGAAWPCRVLLAAVFFQGVNAILGNALRGLGVPGRETLAEVFGLLLTVGLLSVLLPGYGAMGAALSVLVARLAVAFVELRFVSRASGIPMSRFFLWGAV
jgi:O-antigen/teichoic acid export membrane protein